MIFPLLANPKRVPRNQFSLEVGREAMIMGNVPAAQANLSNRTIQIPIIAITWEWLCEVGDSNKDGRKR